MKRFVFSAIYVIAMFVAMSFVACNEYDEDALSRPSRMYEVIVETSGNLTTVETAILTDALIESNVDTSQMRVQTDDITKVASNIKSRLDEINTAMMIAFKVEGVDQDGRYAARVFVGGYSRE